MIKFYFPGEKFPSVSITGDQCALSCPHCRGRFLHGMKSVADPEDLYEFALVHEEEGGEGFLLSGGFTKEGRLPLQDHIEVLSEIKETTSLEINVHTGVPDEDTIEKLASSGIDTVSYDMIGDKSTIETVYSLQLTPEDYKKGYESLKEKGMKVIPHVTVGLNKGELEGEFKAIDLLDEPPMMVLNSLIPQNFGKTVRKDDFFSVMDHIPSKTKIILGCMRERGRDEFEIKALKKGAEGIVIPSKKTISWAEKRYEVEKIEKCCVL